MLLLHTTQSVNEISFQPAQTAVIPERTPRLHYNLTLSFKDDLVKFSIEQNLQFHRFLKNVVETAGGTIEVVGDSNNQITLLVSLKASETVDDFVQRLKIVSAQFVKRRLNYERFEWKSSYKVFSMGLIDRKQTRRKVRTN